MTPSQKLQAVREAVIKRKINWFESVLFIILMPFTFFQGLFLPIVGLLVYSGWNDYIEPMKDWWRVWLHPIQYYE